MRLRRCALHHHLGTKPVRAAAGSAFAYLGPRLVCPVGVAMHQSGSILNGHYWSHMAFPFTVVFPHSQPANSDSEERLPPEAPRPYPLSQAAPVAHGFPDVQVGHRDGVRFFPCGFRSMGRVLERMLRGTAGMAIKPVLRLIDLRLRLGYSI